MRLQITLLKPAEETLPDIPGRQTTLTLPQKLPSIDLFHRTFAQLTAQAPIIVALLGAAKTLFPSPPQIDQQKTPNRASKT